MFVKSKVYLSLFLLLTLNGCGGSSSESASVGDAEDSTTPVDTVDTSDATATTPPEEPNALKTLPAGIVMKSIPAGSFTMGNNNLLGPQAGQATEHEVRLSEFSLSETEISNQQYVSFLNSALEDRLIEVSIGSATGPDAGKQLVVGSESSSYPGKVLYDLDGRRVMKDHDNRDGDDNAFTGDIEPENPLNIAFIGYDATAAKFYVKNPYSTEDFDWYTLCNYFDYSEVPNQKDTTIELNDFSNWSELAGWTMNNPTAAQNLPTQKDVADYPVNFIRWWGAKAFVDYYEVQLPTEAQWEYAAKGGLNFKYSVHDGVDITDANWNQAQALVPTGTVRAVMSGQPNPYGLYNLGGNVWEWMADNYQAYSADDANDPLVEVEGSSLRAWRGGSWNYHQATLETSGRYYDEENRGNDHFGFRIAN